MTTFRLTISYRRSQYGLLPQPSGQLEYREDSGSKLR